LTTTQPSPSETEAHVTRFAFAATTALKDQPEFRSYLRRLLLETIQACHGTLLAVIDDGSNSAGLKDGVWPNPPIDFFALYSGATTSKSADALADLNGAESLLSGMMNSDGVLVFSAGGKLLAYRVFLSASGEEKAVIPEVGGGRRRTYELMKLRLGNSFQSVFFRSQDGETKCEAL
jgi:hypothetical protein